jgi:hypothetical protein
MNDELNGMLKEETVVYIRAFVHLLGGVSNRRVEILNPDLQSMKHGGGGKGGEEGLMYVLQADYMILT